MYVKFYLISGILSPGGQQCLSVRTSLSHNKDPNVKPETSQNRKRKLLDSGMEWIGCLHGIFPWIRHTFEEMAFQVNGLSCPSWVSEAARLSTLEGLENTHELLHF